MANFMEAVAVADLEEGAVTHQWWSRGEQWQSDIRGVVRHGWVNRALFSRAVLKSKSGLRP